MLQKEMVVRTLFLMLLLVPTITIGLSHRSHAATPPLLNPMEDWQALKVHLGIELGQVSDEQAGGRILRGARVLRVLKKSVAFRVGIRPNDYIVKFDGQNINMPQDVRTFMLLKNPRDTADIVILRDGHEITLTAQF
jgi:membrane-associated protease RseP (regulator of RpoE activity)